MADNEKTPAKTIADVAKPGESAPSATSKPVIVTNRTVLQDPMVIAEGNSADSAEPTSRPLPKTSTKAKIQPLNIPAVDGPAAQKDEPDDEPETEPAAEAKDEPTPSPAVDSDKHEPVKVDTKIPKASKTAAVDPEAAAAEAAEREAKLQKLVDAKRYFLPINSVEKRRTKRVVIAGVALSLVLTVAWVDVALDASLIHLAGIKPVTHFFSN